MQDQTDNLKNKAAAFRIAIAQFVISFLIALLLLLILGVEAAYSAMLGGTISTVATMYMGQRIFSSSYETANQAVTNLYVTETLKILFVTALFCVVFILLDVHFIAFVFTYLATILVYWLALMWPVFGFKQL